MIRILANEHIDLLIVDIQMPKMNGYELMHSLRDSGNLLPAIMLTAMNTFVHKEEGFASGVDDYMTKHINYEELIRRIEAILRRAQIANEKKIQIGTYPGIVFTKQKLMDEIWGFDSEIEYDTIKTYISRLRNKFSECMPYK